MATNVSQSEEACTCPVCRDIFRDPVVLPCGHSFCEPCLQEWWRQTIVQKCPVCMEILTMARPARNFALRDLSDIVRKEARQRATSGAQDVCELHNEKLKLFCRDDQQLICLVCRYAQKHEKHNFAPINEAAEEHRINIRTQLMHLNSKLGSLKAHQLNCNKMASHIKLQAQQTETTIKEEFQKLYQFLRTKEAARIDALRKEVALKSDTLNNRIVSVNEEVALLADRIETIHQELKAEDLAFMLNYKSTLERSQHKVQEPETPPGCLIDEAEHVGNLLFKVWDQMKYLIKYTSVTLDPTTSGTQLILSENLTHASESKTAQQLPDNPERKGPSIVLGFEGFRVGRPSWSVEVNGLWAVGVAAKTKHAPIFGIYTFGPEGPLSDLITGKRIDSISTDILPKKIKVSLDLSQRTVSFFDLDREKCIHIIELSSREKVFPYFQGTVKILPAEVRTTMMIDASPTKCKYREVKYITLAGSLRK